MKQRAVEALTAGNDIELPSNNCYKYLSELIGDSLVNEKYFEIAVKRALMLKARLGLLSTDRKLYATGNLDLIALNIVKLMTWHVNPLSC